MAGNLTTTNKIRYLPHVNIGSVINSTTYSLLKNPDPFCPTDIFDILQNCPNLHHVFKNLGIFLDSWIRVIWDSDQAPHRCIAFCPTLPQVHDFVVFGQAFCRFFVF